MKNKTKTYTIIFLLVAPTLFMVGYLNKSNKSVEQINVLESQSIIVDVEKGLAIAKENGAKLIDVRTKEEYESGHVSNAINIDWENQDVFKVDVESLSKEGTYVLYCRSGNRSLQAAQYMQSKGFLHVYSMKEGSSSGKLPIENSIISSVSTDTTKKIKSVLDIAILDEYKAKATYERVLEKYPNTRPFSNIINAEQNHINSLLSLYTTYNVTPPTYINTLPAYTGTLAEACQTGVKAEIANVKLYTDDLLPQVKSDSDIANVFTNLYTASQNNHLPAFKKCS